VSLEEVMLAAFAAAWRRWARQSTLFIDLEHHGREHVVPGVDLTRTVGWFTAIAPVAITIPDAASMTAAVDGVRRQLRDMPQHGFGYGVLRYLGRDEISHDLRRRPSPEIAFNYLGNLDGPARRSRFALLPDLQAPARDPHAIRAHLLEVTAALERGRLRMSWIYSRHRHRPSSIRVLARRFRHAVARLLRECGHGAP
jgi:non-ribosomal peptide synthase protein (TIGR01720 family)